MSIRWFSDRIKIEADFKEFLMVDKIASVKYKGRYFHGVKDVGIGLFKQFVIALMDDIFWARKAFAASLESSLLQMLEVMIRSSGIQLA